MKCYQNSMVSTNEHTTKCAEGMGMVLVSIGSDCTGDTMWMNML